MGSRVQERPFYRHDTVRRRDGGPEMTVVHVFGDLILCEWVERDVLIRRERFPAHVLEMSRRG